MINKPQQGVWQYGILWLLFLAPFFFLSYGFANQYASQLINVPSIVFAWEQHIPLWAWTIIPYWSIDLFYGLSLLLCFSRHELKQHALRLFSAQIIAVSCFLLFPLKFSVERPEINGFFGFCFDVLMGFDQPFNQAPSLHIVLLVILWDFYRRHIDTKWHWLVDLWSFLIGLSVLTTWQHHFIDLPTGILVGAICLWLFPLQGFSPINFGRQQFTCKHLKFASYYLTAAISLTILAYMIQSWAWWLLYPATSLLLIACAYLLRQANFFQKQANGSMTIASYILFAPYLIFAWLNSRLWTKKHPEDNLIIQHDHISIYLGRIPSTTHAQQYSALFDCCAELPCSRTEVQYDQAFYSLDLIPIQAAQLNEAVLRFNSLIQQANQQQQTQKLLIFCALGYSRSSSILIAWLIQQGLVTTPLQGMQLIQRQRPWIVLKTQHLQQLQQWQQHYVSR